jgi:uncharacterized protein (DUF305 family)
MVRQLGWLVVAALLAAGCAAPRSQPPLASDQTDIWFMQHMVPHLRQTTVLASLTRERLTDPRIAGLTDTMTRRSQADIDQLQRWLDQRGLSPHGHSHQRVDGRRQTGLERLARRRGDALDLAFIQVMKERSGTARSLAATEVRDGSLPEVRQLARQMLAEQQAQARQLRRLRQDLTAGMKRRVSMVSRRRGPGRAASRPRPAAHPPWVGTRSP